MYSYKLNESVYQNWSQNINEWIPLTHSCEPNMWLGENFSLDWYAKNDIKKNEVLTVEFATIKEGNQPNFECDCNSANCRGVIKSDDYLKEFNNAYGSRLSL